jgi:hypothetical protein
VKLTKIVFKGSVDGIFGESVSSLSTEVNPTIRHVRDLEVTLLGLIVTREDGARRWVPLSWCGTGDVAGSEMVDELPPGLNTEKQLSELSDQGVVSKPRRGGKAKAT